MTESSVVCVYSADDTTDIHRLADAARRAGVDTIHLNCQTVQRYVESGTDLGALMNRPAFHGLAIGGADVFPLTAESDGTLDGQIGRIETQMQVAARLGLSAVSITGGARNAVAEQFLMSGLTQLVPIARRLGLDICLRNRRDTVLEQTMDLHRAFAATNDDNLKFDLDAAEFHQACVNPCEPVLAFPKRIAKVRLSDVRTARPEALGCGEINALAIAGVLSEVQFVGSILLELGNDPGAVDRLQGDRRFVQTTGLSIR